MSDSSDDEAPQLSAHALAALQEFYAEQADKAQEEQEAMEAGQAAKTGIIQEDWVRLKKKITSKPCFFSFSFFSFFLSFKFFIFHNHHYIIT